MSAIKKLLDFSSTNWLLFEQNDWIKNSQNIILKAQWAYSIMSITMEMLSFNHVPNNRNRAHFELISFRLDELHSSLHSIMCFLSCVWAQERIYWSEAVFGGSQKENSVDSFEINIIHEQKWMTRKKKSIEKWFSLWCFVLFTMKLSKTGWTVYNVWHLLLKPAFMSFCFSLFEEATYGLAKTKRVVLWQNQNICMYIEYDCIQKANLACSLWCWQQVMYDILDALKIHSWESQRVQSFRRLCIEPKAKEKMKTSWCAINIFQLFLLSNQKFI